MKKKGRIWIYHLAIIGLFLMITSSCKKEENSITVTDIDGNVYHTVTIGTQVWMVENLKVTNYRNGDAIANINDNTAWTNLVTGACCDFENTPGNSAIYGKLYNWYAIYDSRKIAPAGWHVPTDVEWATLTNYLGGQSIAGGKLKETDTTHWLAPNTDATNASGFSALPGGLRTFHGVFANFWGSSGYWWSATEFNTTYAWYYYLNCNDPSIHIGEYHYKSCGFSVRCVKD